MDTTLTGSGLAASPAATTASLALAIAWCADDPSRIGEVLHVAQASQLVGRGEQRADDPHSRARFLRDRPGVSVKQPPLASKRLSRQQLRITSRGANVALDVLGRCPTFVNGVLTTKGATLGEGDTIRCEGALVLVCVRRPKELPALRDATDQSFAFGEPDGLGIVGESPAVWQLRDRIDFIARTPSHVLLTGDSGVGKELVARALHRRSTRGEGALVSRNAATLPAGIIDAELFGHAANYPNPGTPARSGIIGEADGGTLFLDEIGELPSELQAHLLRVLDADGEYQRLGETASRHSDLRLVAATNRREDELKSDLLARFKLRLHVPNLGERREDIPLLLLHLARHAAEADERVAARFVGDHGPRLAIDFVDALLRHQFSLHVRELDNLLWTAISESPRDVIALTAGVTARLSHRSAFADPSSVSKQAIVDALAACDNNQQRAFQLLNLKNRDVLYRLLKKHGIKLR